MKQGTLVKTGTSLGIILKDELKFTHHNHYAWVYYFDHLGLRDGNPGWVFVGNFTKVS